MVEGYLTRNEGKTLEFKENCRSLKSIVKTVVAFTNTSGGTIIIGVRDRTGEVVGLKAAKDDEERLANAISDNVCPNLLPDIIRTTYKDKELIMVSVSRWPGPFYVKAEGPVNGVYIRLGSTNRRAGTEKIADLRRTANHIAFDQLPCVNTEIADLNMKAIKKAFSTVRRTIDEAKLESLGVLVRYDRHLIPSNGGIILFGNETVREKLFPDSQVRCARFAGTEKVDFLDRLDIEGTVLQALEEVPKFIRRNTRMAARIEGMRREDIPEYPRVALREALVNAIAHTDYSLRGIQIMIAVFSNRLEIQNPGTLPLGLTIDDLKNGVSRIRNPVIARVLRELNLMEKWGTGYKRICNDCDNGGYKYPEWTELSSVMRISFSPHSHLQTDASLDNLHHVPANVPANVPVNERQVWFLEGLATGEEVRAKDIAWHFGVALKTAKRDISGLKEIGCIEFVGATKTGYYRLTGCNKRK